MQAFRPIAFLFALFALSACAYGTDNTYFAPQRCETGTAEEIQGVDWEVAKKLNLRIRQGDFNPVYMSLVQNQAYVLAIENGDNVGHTFRAMEFFQAVAIGGVRVADGQFEQVSCLKGVSIPPGMQTVIRFVAVRDGTYEFDDNSLMFSLAMVGSSGGFITIEQPRVLPESPLKHLKLFVREPIIETPEDIQPRGLFDDQQEQQTPPGGGLFDDAEEPIDGPPSGLFDDPEPEQPIDASPAVPVETAPEPAVEQDTPPLPENLFDDAPQPDALEGLFDDSPLDGEPQQPEEPVVRLPSQTPADLEAPLDLEPPLDIEPPFEPDALDFEPDAEIMMEEVQPELDIGPEEPAGELSDDEEFFFVEETTDDIPDISPDQTLDETMDVTLEETLDEAPVQSPQQTPDDAAPSQPQDYDILEGPPADIYSDPPDVVTTKPGSGGTAGDDQFEGSG